jgi:hypothetical protein
MNAQVERMLLNSLFNCLNMQGVWRPTFHTIGDLESMLLYPERIPARLTMELTFIIRMF